MGINELTSRLINNDKELTEIIFPASEEINLDDLHKIVNALKNNTCVLSLQFLDNFLTPEHITLIGEIKCQSLIELSVQNNNISDDHLHHLLKLASLQSINLSYNNLSDRGAEMLANHPNLTMVNVNFNRIENTGISSLLASNKLIHLEAEGNGCDPEISDAVFANHSLKLINLRNQQIDRTLNNRFKTHAATNNASSHISQHFFLQNLTSIIEPPLNEERKNTLACPLL